MKILLTGGAGFIGSHVADRFIDMGHDVVILDNLSSGIMDDVNPEAIFIRGDITDGDLVNRIFGEHHFDVVNHHAAQMNVRHSAEDPILDASVNILGTINLLKAGVETGIKKFMFASTGGAVYGEQEYFPADEKHPTNPVSPYGISKLAGEKYISYFTRQDGAAYSLLRYANIYGPRQNPHGEAGVVAIFSKKLAAGATATINGDGLQTRDFVFVEDVVNANEAALLHDGSICMNVGTGIETSVATIYERLASAAQRDYPPRYGPGKPGEQRRSVISANLAKEAIGWEPARTLEEGLTTTYQWFLAQPLEA